MATHSGPRARDPTTLRTDDFAPRSIGERSRAPRGSHNRPSRNSLRQLDHPGFTAKRMENVNGFWALEGPPGIQARGLEHENESFLSVARTNTSVPVTDNPESTMPLKLLESSPRPWHAACFNTRSCVKLFLPSDRCAKTQDLLCLHWPSWSSASGRIQPFSVSLTRCC